MSPQATRTDPYQLVTETILTHLEHGVIPWRCPWKRTVGRPRNFHSGREYQGINTILLGLMHFPSPWWLTFRQANECGGRVRKGEHGTPVMKWGRYEKELENDDGTEEKKTVFYVKTYRVFNAVQVEGIEFPLAESGPELNPSQRIRRAEQIAQRMPHPPKIDEGRTTMASYRPCTDTVEMPAFQRFDTPEDFYLTLFHELTHSTGHESRLARKGIMKSDGFSGKTYSQEELVAEIGAAFLGMEAGIVRDQHEQSAAYLKGWMDVLREPEHRRWIIQAANKAGRATDFILGKHDKPASEHEEPSELLRIAA